MNYLKTWFKNSPKNNTMAVYALSYEKCVEDNIYGNPMFKNIMAFILYTNGYACIQMNADRMAFDTHEIKATDEKKYNRKAIKAIFRKDFTIYG